MPQKGKGLDKRQSMFLENYFSPTSDSYCNAYKSAIKAGFKEQYAKNITSQLPKWLSEQMGYRERVVNKAKNKLEKFIDDDSDKRVCSDLVKFTLKTIGKNEGFSEKVEVETTNKVSISDDEFKKIIETYNKR